jgi:hypothetical protein
MDQTCAQGRNMTRYVVGDAGWTLTTYLNGNKYPTYGYETTTLGNPLTFEVDTSSPGPVGAGTSVMLTYTKAKAGYGNATVT